MNRHSTEGELSTARATEVVRYLQEKGGIDSRLLSAFGFSEYQPVAANDSDAGGDKNRRIEIVLLPPLKSRDLASAGSCRRWKALTRARLNKPNGRESQSREVALFMGASGSCLRWLH